MKMNLLIITLLLVSVPLYGFDNSILFSKIKSDITDTLSTGMPISVFSAVWWCVANRIPSKWPDLDEPAVGFIRRTWKEQGFKHADTIVIKEIPADSIFARVAMYTQELPGALAIGIPFRKKIESLLLEQERLIQEANDATVSEQEVICFRRLAELEKKLDECRFICGHERVHQQHHHTYQSLVIQFVTPFIVYSLFKHTANAFDRHETLREYSYVLRKGSVRSCVEMSVYWAFAHYYERQADLHASTDPEIIEAGITLFERAQRQKIKIADTRELDSIVLLWFLKYTHPTTSERLKYLQLALARSKHEQLLQGSVKSQFFS